MNANGEPSSQNPSTSPGSGPASAALSINNNKKRNRTNDNLRSGTYVSSKVHVPSKSQTPGPSFSDSPFDNQSKPSTMLTPTSPIILDSPQESRRTSIIASNLSLKDNAVSSPSKPSARSWAGQNSGLFDVDEITNAICGYPRHMLRPKFWSPFVHHRHYRCWPGGLAEPIAIALCCVAAGLQSVESSVPFICKIINDERDNLINDFPTKSRNPEDAIAVVHAMCIYQIETITAFRSQKPVKGRVSSTELYQHFLLKMTRRLCQQSIEKISLKDNTATSWHCWTMAESLRRSTFLVYMVNELSYHTNALNGEYYESLHESLLLDMPLPAPDSMWRASTEEDWVAAREATGWTGTGVLTLSSSMDRLEAVAGGLGRSSESEGTSSDNIQQISKLIISTARHLRRESF